MKKNYHAKNDIMFQNYIENTSEPLSPLSIEKYENIINKFCKFNNRTLEDIVTTCKEEQLSRIKTTENGESVIIEFDPNEPTTTIRKLFTTFQNKCKEKGNKNNTINYQTTVIKTFLNYYKIKLPIIKKLKSEKKKWYLLTKEDIKFILDDSNIIHKSLITFLLSSGLRLRDALSLTIGDFMEATKEYHNYIEVDEFIDNAPEDMIGYWDFNPNKTKRYNIECKTFNSAESSNYILQHLRKIKNEYISTKNKGENTHIKLSKTGALFPSRNEKYTDHIIPESISTQFTRKNKKLEEHNITKIKKQIEEGKISKEDEEKEIKKIPKFHAHACRKYFESMIAKNCGDIRICTIIEGHKSPIRTDPSYIKKNKDELKEAYLKALADLTIEKIESRILTNTQSEKLNQELNELRKEKEELQEHISELKEQSKENKETTSKEIENLQEIINTLSVQLTKEGHQTQENIDRKQAITDYIINKGDILITGKTEEYTPTKLEEKLQSLTIEEKIGLSEIAYEFIEYDTKFTPEPEYLERVTKKALREWRKNPILMDNATAHNRILQEDAEKINEINKKIIENLNEDGFYEDDEIEEITSNILNHIIKNRKKLANQEINDEFIDELVDSFI